MAEAIKNLRFKQNQVHEKEFREMADGAQQTIKTMQEMIQQKNEYIRKKEDHITNLRDQMLQQAERDALSINQLREQLSITGSTTLNKMHQIVSKHGGQEEKNRAQTAQLAHDRKT